VNFKGLSRQNGIRNKFKEEFRPQELLTLALLIKIIILL